MCKIDFSTCMKDCILVDRNWNKSLSVHSRKVIAIDLVNSVIEVSVLTIFSYVIIASVCLNGTISCSVLFCALWSRTVSCISCLIFFLFLVNRTKTCIEMLPCHFHVCYRSHCVSFLSAPLHEVVHFWLSAAKILSQPFISTLFDGKIETFDVSFIWLNELVGNISILVQELVSHMFHINFAVIGVSAFQFQVHLKFEGFSQQYVSSLSFLFS